MALWQYLVALPVIIKIILTAASVAASAVIMNGRGPLDVGTGAMAMLMSIGIGFVWLVHS